jgi:hypothetical protein
MLLGLYQITLVFITLTMVGKLLIGQYKNLSGAVVLIGWGILCLLVTVSGVILKISLQYSLYVFVFIACISISLDFYRLNNKKYFEENRQNLFKLLGLSLPLIWIVKDIQPSEIDVLCLILPNSAYLFDHNHFPTSTGPESFSDLPVAPYNTEFIPYLGSIFGGGFASNTLSLLTIFLHLTVSLLIAEILSYPKKEFGFRVLAVSFALVTFLSPGFAPKLFFSGMGEGPIAICLFYASWIFVKLQEEKWSSKNYFLMISLALILTTLINIKQQAIGIVLSVVFGMLWIICHDIKDENKKTQYKIILRFLTVTFFPFLLFFMWRYYVITFFPDGELKVIPFREWIWIDIPKILLQMGIVLLKKGYFLLSLLSVLYFYFRPPMSQKLSTKILTRLCFGTIVIFNGYLLMTYIGHFREEHSYYRYMSELSILISMTNILNLKDYVEDKYPLLWLSIFKKIGSFCIVLMLCLPIILEQLVRFDQDMPQPLMRQWVKHMGQVLQKDQSMAIMLNGDDGQVTSSLEGLLRFGESVHQPLVLSFYHSVLKKDFDDALEKGFTTAFVSCTDSGLFNLPPHGAAILHYQNNQWSLLDFWSYPEFDKKSKYHRWGWLPSLSLSAFCIK